MYARVEAEPVFFAALCRAGFRRAQTQSPPMSDYTTTTTTIMITERSAKVSVYKVREVRRVYWIARRVELENTHRVSAVGRTIVVVVARGRRLGGITVGFSAYIFI